MVMKIYVVFWVVTPCSNVVGSILDDHTASIFTLWLALLFSVIIFWFTMKMKASWS